MSTNKNKKRLGAIAGVTAVALVGGGLAVAYWTTTGTGTGTGTVGTDTAVTVTQTSSVSGLVPGGPAQDLDFDVLNPAAGPQTINAVNISVSTTAVGCDVNDFTIVQPNLGGAVQIAAGGTYSNSTATVALQNTSANQDACKLAPLVFTYNVS
jgi:hypothetical protein